MYKSITDRSSGLNFHKAKAIAGNYQIFITLSGNSFSSVESNEKSKKAFAKFLREAANKIEKW